MGKDYTSFVSVNDQYNKDPKLKRDDVIALQRWMAKEAHLPAISELKMILFLHSNFYKIEATKQCIENYFTIKANCDEIFGHYDIYTEGMRNINKLFLVNLVASKPEYKVVLGTARDENPDLMQAGTVFFLCDLITHLSYIQHGISDGHIVILDGANVKFGHVFKVSITVAKIFMMYVQTALPIRLKAVHVVNVSPAVEKLYALCRPFIKGELISLLHLHSSLDEFHKHLPRDCIPKDLGGDGPSYEDMYDDELKRMEANAKYIHSYGMERADESKRQKKINIDHMFGYEGTFKKLQID